MTKTKAKKSYKKTAIISAAFMSTLSIFVASQGLPQTGTTAYADTLTPANCVQAVDNILSPYVSKNNFSGTVLLEKHGTILVDKAYGYANFSQKTANTTKTRFAIGSLTQAFTAVAIMQLKEQGLLNLSDSISKYLTNFTQAQQPITIEELLTHTSGAPSSSNQPTVAPGTTFQYSILNYLLLGQIIEKVSGQSYASYIQQHILTPLGMNDTGVIGDMSNVPNSATGYVPVNNVITPVDLQAQNFTSSDGIYSTADDLYKFDQALYTGKLVNRQDVQQMFTANPVAVATLKAFGYGYGWQVTLSGTAARNESTFGGFHSYMERDMDNDETLIILTNEDWSSIDNVVPQLESVLVSTQVSSPTASSTVGGQKEITVNGSVLSKPFSRVAFGTTHMPIWYIGQALQSLGVKQTWDGTNHVWNITLPASIKADFSNVDIGQGNTDIFVNGQLVKRINTYAWLDPASGNKSYTVYAPIYYVQQLLGAAGIVNNWDGNVWSASSH